MLNAVFQRNTLWVEEYRVFNGVPEERMVLAIKFHDCTKRFDGT